MGDKHERHVLLTAWSTVNPNLIKDGLELENIYVEEFGIEFEDIKKSVVTSESALKYLVVPREKGNRIDPIPIEKIFAFTTKTVEEVANIQTDICENTFANAVKNKEKITAKEYIKHRVRRIGELIGKSEWEKCIVDEPIDDNIDSTYLSSMESIINMSNKVMAYAHEHKEEQLIIHVDPTGGFRDAPISLLIVLNILEKNGIKIGKVLYSMSDIPKKKVNVKDITKVYNMQMLTSGVHEFVEFGQAKTINDYTTRNKKEIYAEPLQNLLAAINVFSEMLTFSDRAQFKEAINTIKMAYQEFKKFKSDDAVDKDVKNDSELLKLLTPRIEEEYSPLWNVADELDYIEWCLDHNYIQQALTLCIEIIPDVLFGKGSRITKLCGTKEENLICQAFENATAGEKVYGFNYFILNKYKPKGLDGESDHEYIKKSIETCIEEILENNKNETLEGKDIKAEVLNYIKSNIKEELKDVFENSPEVKRLFEKNELQEVIKQIKVLREDIKKQWIETIDYITTSVNENRIDDLTIQKLKEYNAFSFSLAREIEVFLRWKQGKSEEEIREAIKNNEKDAAVTKFMNRIKGYYAKYTPADKLVKELKMPRQFIGKQEPNKVRDMYLDWLKERYKNLSNQIDMDPLITRKYVDNRSRTDSIMKAIEDQSLAFTVNWSEVANSLDDEAKMAITVMLNENVVKEHHVKPTYSIHDNGESDLLALQMIRYILYSYGYLKDIRNATVHAREKRDERISKEFLKDSISMHIKIIRILQEHSNQ